MNGKERFMGHSKIILWFATSFNYRLLVAISFTFTIEKAINCLIFVRGYISESNRWFASWWIARVFHGSEGAGSSCRSRISILFNAPLIVIMLLLLLHILLLLLLAEGGSARIFKLLGGVILPIHSKRGIFRNKLVCIVLHCLRRFLDFLPRVVLNWWLICSFLARLIRLLAVQIVLIIVRLGTVIGRSICRIIWIVTLRGPAITTIFTALGSNVRAWLYPLLFLKVTVSDTGGVLKSSWLLLIILWLITSPIHTSTIIPISLEIDFPLWVLRLIIIDCPGVGSESV